MGVGILLYRVIYLLYWFLTNKAANTPLVLYIPTLLVRKNIA